MRIKTRKHLYILTQMYSDAFSPNILIHNILNVEGLSEYGLYATIFSASVLNQTSVGAGNQKD